MKNNRLFPSLEELATKAAVKGILAGKILPPKIEDLTDIAQEALDKELALAICTAIEAKEEIRCTNIEKALHHAAFARKEDIEIVLKMVKDNPCLMLEAGNVLTPGGLLVKRVTLYEFFLGAGDPDAAKQVKDCFFKSIEEYNQKLPKDMLKVEEVENAFHCQYERYRLHIEGMLTQEPYDLKPLIDIIRQASREDVLALFNNDMTHESSLRDAMIQFRKDWAPGVLDKPGMHFNYHSLLHAFQLYDDEWHNLYAADENNYHKVRLVMRQVIGFMVRRLSSVDRCAFAQGIYHLTTEDSSEILNRSFGLRYGGCAFPVCVSDDSFCGLGLNYMINGNLVTSADIDPFMDDGEAYVFRKLCQTKISGLQSLQPKRTQLKRPSV